MSTRKATRRFRRWTYEFLQFPGKDKRFRMVIQGGKRKYRGIKQLTTPPKTILNHLFRKSLSHRCRLRRNHIGPEVPPRTRSKFLQRRLRPALPPLVRMTEAPRQAKWQSGP